MKQWEHSPSTLLQEAEPGVISTPGDTFNVKTFSEIPQNQQTVSPNDKVLHWETTPSPYVVAFANQKGGVAKTTCVASLAGALVYNDQDVLVIDLDSQANLTLALGKNPAKVRSAISEVLFNSAALASVSRETRVPGLDLAPSDSGMELAERFLPVRKNYETILRSAIQEIASIRPTSISSLHKYKVDSSPSSVNSHLSNNYRELHPRPIYDYIILDCPPSMGAVTMNAINAADLLIIPTQPEYFSAHALRSMMATIQQIRNTVNPNLVYRILITMFDQRNRIHRQVEKQIRNTFAEGVFETTIGIDTKLRESALEGLPITHYKNQSRGSLQYQALAQELVAYVHA
jgi:chromosome partitioning protein